VGGDNYCRRENLAIIGKLHRLKKKSKAQMLQPSMLLVFRAHPSSKEFLIS
jgi:hypothetical protein